MRRPDCPLVSIAINNYNYARFLPACIESALVQTYANTEVIVVDDGSRDESRQAIESFTGRVIGHFKPNGGQASAINTGFAMSAGEIVIFLDSDDLLLPDIVERIVDAWEPGAAKVHFPLLLMDEAGRDLDERIPTTSHEGDVTPIILRFGAYASPPSSGNAYSRAVLKKIMPIPESDWRIAADTYPIILAAFFGEVINLPEAGGAYRIHRKDAKSRFVMNNNPSTPAEALRRLERSRLLIGTELQRRGLQPTAFFELEPPTAARMRIISRRVDKAESPAASSRMMRIVRDSVRSVWHWPDFTTLARILYTVWFVAVAFLPMRLAERLIIWAIDAQRRPQWLKAAALSSHTRGPAVKRSRKSALA